MKNSFKRELHNLKFLLSKAAAISPGYLWASVAEALFGAGLPFVAILFPKFMIDEMLGQRRIEALSLYVLGAVLSALILSAGVSGMRRYRKAALQDLLSGFEVLIGGHNMGVAYKNLEDVGFIEQRDKAMVPIRDRMILWTMAHYLPDMLKSLLTILGAVGLMLSFDIISLIAILIPTSIIALFNRRYQRQDMEIQKRNVRYTKKFRYYWELMYNFGAGKDIRIFELHKLLTKRNNDNDDLILNEKRLSGNLQCSFAGKTKVLEALRSSFVFGYIGVKAIADNLGIGSFTMYINAAGTFSQAVSAFLDSFIILRRDCRYLEDFVLLNDVPVEQEQGGITDIGDGEIYLEFKDVSFRYPGSCQDVLQHVSFTLGSRESCSIVGKNGAGKTTIIKLLARLFKPTDGQILLNGIDIETIDSDKYRSLLSVVFQDFKIFEFSVAENVAGSEDLNEEKMNRALEKAGILNKVSSLPKGAQTFVGKQFEPDGTEFSGGELQKLAIARSLYKDAPVIVLDEPTAALDPYAEEEVYSKFHQLTGGRMAVYISHRLSSCKFCQRILFLEEGAIREDGSHEELMELNGQYAAMFRLQASQYVN